MKEYPKESAVEAVCIGETMLMLAPPRYELIECSDIFRAYNGGAESNVAIGKNKPETIGKQNNVYENAFFHQVFSSFE